jgi:3',5'-cyclic AMP phosphodiesterase CpdA
MSRCLLLLGACLWTSISWAVEPKPLRVVQLSDLHVCHVEKNPPGRFLGDPLARDLVHSRELLRRAIDQINTLRPDAVVVTGDLTDRGDDLRSLREVKAELDRLHCPYHPVIGDHDRPEVFTQVFPGPLDYYFDLGSWRLVALGLRAGSIEKASIAWLSDVLEKSRARQVAIFMHRPLYCDPFTLQIASKLYSVKLYPGNAEETLRVISAHPEVKLVLSGHAHVARRDKLGPIDMLWAPALVGPPHCFQLITLEAGRVACQVIPLAPRD